MITSPYKAARPRGAMCLAAVALGTLLSASFAAPLSAESDVAALTKQLSDKSAEAREAAAEKIGGLGEAAKDAVPALIEMTRRDAAPRVRAAACEALGRLQLQPDETIPALIKACADNTEVNEFQHVFTFAGASLSKFHETAVPLLKKMLQSDDEDVVREAGFAVSQLGPLAADTVDELIDVLRQDRPRTRIHALSGLLEIGEPAKVAIPDLIKTLDHENFHARYWACRGLGAMGEDALPAVDKLVALLADGEVLSVRRNAAAALGNIGPKGGLKVVDGLVPLLSKKNYFLQEAAVIALGKLAPLSNPIKPALEKVLEERWFRVRAHAARTLWQMEPGNQIAVALLLKELKSEQAPYDAAVVLGDIGAEMKVIPQVAAALRHDNPLVRQCAADALGRMGKAAATQQAALRKAASGDEDAEVREAAAEALQRIEADTAP